MGTNKTPRRPEHQAKRARLTARFARVLRGPSAGPWWPRPGLILVTLLAAGLYTWALDASGYG